MKAKILKATEENIRICAQALKEGKLVAFPTETVYGLGANAFNPEAVARIFEVKERPYFDPLIVHIASEKEKVMEKIEEVADVSKLTSDQRSLLQKLVEKFFPGPLTLVLPKSRKIPSIVTAGLETVAVRMPSHETARKLIKEAGVPVAAPSANKFSRLSPTKAEHVAYQLGEEIDYIIDDGKTPLGVESTVIDLTQEIPVLLRPGGLPVEEIAEVAGKVELPHGEVVLMQGEPVSIKESPGSTSGPQKNIKSPGMLKKHYAPSKPLILIDESLFHERAFAEKLHKMAREKTGNDNPKIALLLIKIPGPQDLLKKLKSKFHKVEVLSTRGDMKEAASNLFDALHRLQNSPADLIIATKPPEEGLGRAILDRLEKASAE